jgi:hypothetical protein
LSLGAGDDLGTVAFSLQPQATVLKSSPAPQVLFYYLIYMHNHKSTEDDNVSIPIIPLKNWGTTLF